MRWDHRIKGAGKSTLLKDDATGTTQPHHWRSATLPVVFAGDAELGMGFPSRFQPPFMPSMRPAPWYGGPRIGPLSAGN